MHIEENFAKGLTEGVRKEWHTNGTLKVETYYRKGFRLGSHSEWYDHGALKRHSEFSAGRQTGVETQWYPDGELKSRLSYSQGLLQGVKSAWHENGRLMLQCSYVLGERHGRERKWDPDGRLISEQIYVQGALLDKDTNDLLKSGRLTAEHILKMRNAAVRRVCLEEFGYTRFLNQLKHAVVDKQGEDELVRIDWHRSEEPIHLVKVKCPSAGAFYALRVPPKVKTVKEAIAWTFGMEKEKYLPQLET